MRRTSLVYLIISIALLSSLLVVGCAPAARSSKEEPTKLSIASGSIGGTTNLIANCLAGFLKESMGINVTILTYDMKRTAPALGEGVVQLAISNTTISIDPYKGTGDWKDRPPLSGLREITPTAINTMEIFVPVGSPVKTFRDLKGKRVSPGTKGMGQIDILINGCKAIGLDFEKDFNPVYMGHAEAGAALVAGKIDAYVTLSPPPHPVISETDIVHPLRLIGFTEEDVKIFVNVNPGSVKVTIPAKYYHMDKPSTTVAGIGQLLAMNDFSEEIVYQLLKYLNEHNDSIGYYYTAFQKFMADPDLGAKTMVETGNNPIPFHKGAIRYYQEIGWKVPPERIPPEAKK